MNAQRLISISEVHVSREVQLDHSARKEQNTIVNNTAVYHIMLHIWLNEAYINEVNKTSVHVFAFLLFSYMYFHFFLKKKIIFFISYDGSNSLLK